MKKRLIISLLLACLIYFLVSVNYWRSANYFRIVFLDVGQGDSVLIVTPTGQTILIDGGPDDRVLKELGHALPFWLRRLDLVILTHVHDDHLAGLITVLNRYKIKQVLIGNYNNETPLTKAWQDKLLFYKTDIIKASPGMTFNFSEHCSLSILAAAEKAVDENDLSIVSLFSCLDKKVLLSGDASFRIENNLEISQVDIFKAAHHGSLTANSQSFLDKIRPRLAIISVGLNNKFNHPNLIVLNRLLTIAVNIFRTDEMGSIYFLANNKAIIWKK